MLESPQQLADPTASAGPRRIYLDGNSLGPPSLDMAARMAAFVTDEWHADLIGGWNGQGWWDLPVAIGDRIGDLIGAGPGQVIAADTTTVLLYKALVAGLYLRPDRDARPWIVTHTGNFPTDRHVLDGVARQFGAQVEAVAAADMADAICDGTAIVYATHVDFRSGARLDIGALTAAAHAKGAVVVWDLSHSAGAMDLHLDRDDVDLAVGCSYKFLNGGPGAPAFLYAAERHHDDLVNAVPGWIGDAQPFAMLEEHRPAPGIRRMLSGTPPVIGLRALDIALDRFDDVDMADLRRHSVALTERFIELADRDLAPHGFTVASPRDADRRGSHVSLGHRDAYAIVQAMIAAGVVGDFREPNLCRFGFAPLHLTLNGVDEAVARLLELMETGAWQDPKFAERRSVT